MIIKFKLFESNIHIYKEGDFILLNLDEIKKNIEEWIDLPDDILAKITYVDSDDSYDVEIFNSNKNEGYNVKLSEILRLLTTKEIKMYKEKKRLYNVTKKYNL